ncbi:MAG: type II toxin-antitoxin system VapC family toxin [Methanobacteriota archaeon]
MNVLDTDVLIDLGANRPLVAALVRGFIEDGEVIATTSINAGEFLRGVQGHRERLAARTRILDAIPQLPTGPAAARRFARIMHALDRAGSPIPELDGLIAAATLEAGGRLVTRNVRHFGRVPGLEVLVPGAKE